MKKILLTSLLLCGFLFTGFIGLDLRPSFSYEIFRSPYYRLIRKTAPAANAQIGFVAATLDARAMENPTFKDARMPALLEAINQYVQDSLSLQPLNISTPKLIDGPDIFLGSVLQGQRPLYITADCPQEKESPEYCIRLAGQLGNKAWMQQLQEQISKNNLDYALVLQIGEGYLYPNGKMKRVNALIEKRSAPQAGLDMGTNFWLPMSQKLVATNKPIDVLFIKGFLIRKDGKVIRLGGEGITAASKARFLEQAVNISHEFSEEELNSVQNNVRREDLPGRPLNWQIAARHLVKTLTNPNLESRGGYIK
ncbi:hypothetical protein [Adhaeribacter soli]|uniref:Uncharacterized protein n=1 Tax=Adhaeribacter soli TaxID=2607655 RepID=A0A5N1IZU1_9BACT|nr:hypothetical protein [Adhaeribacter soli]KAA9339965.1 hypothetical protein F0P94_06330 [Adhaeribacter soli]